MRKHLQQFRDECSVGHLIPDSRFLTPDSENMADFPRQEPGNGNQESGQFSVHSIRKRYKVRLGAENLCRKKRKGRKKHLHL